MSAKKRSVVAVLSALLVAAAFAGSVDAQRKGKGKRRGKRQATQQVAEPTPAPEPAVDESVPAEGEALEPEAEAATTTGDGEGEAAATAAEPAPAPPTTAAEPETPEAPVVDLAPLRTELAAVMDELVQARARVGILGKTLFKTRVRVTVQNLTQDTQRLGRIVLKLDGAPVFSGGADAVKGDEENQVFEGFAAPGPHTLVLEVEQIGRDDDEYRYSLRESYRFVLPRERSTVLRLILDDDSDMAEDFADDEEGEYDVRTRLEVRAHPIGED